MPRLPRLPIDLRFNRRRLLQSLGAAAVLSPFVPLFDVRGEAEAPPRRVILIYTPHGTVHDKWNPQGTEFDFTLPELLAPFEPYKDSNLIVLKGLRLNGIGGKGPHTRGMPLLFTGSEQLPGDKYEHGGEDDDLGWGGNVNASVDQVLAQAFTGRTPLDSLFLGYQCGGTHVANRMSFSGPDAPMTPIEDPQQAWDQLFGLAALGQEAYERLKLKRTSSIDVVRSELNTLRARLGTQERPKLDAHLQALVDIEKGLQSAYECSVDPLGEPVDAGANESSGVVLSRHIQMIVAALRCDMTRIVTLQVARGEWDANTYPWLDQGGVGLDYHHSHSHNEGPGNAVQALLIRMRRYYAEKVAELVAALAATPEGDGTMLDNTMVVWGSEVANGYTHSFNDMPFVVLGGRNFLRSGRFAVHQDVAHHRLLVAILHAMGKTDVENFGENDVDVGSGPLDGLLL